MGSMPGLIWSDRSEVRRAGSCRERRRRLSPGVDVQVVLARGRPGGDGARPGPAPANFIVSDFPPQIALLGRAAVFIGHGGVSSTLEALQLQPELGLPIVFRPRAWDQYVTAHQVARAGAGLVLPQEPDAAAIRVAVRRAIEEPALREGARA